MSLYVDKTTAVIAVSGFRVLSMAYGSYLVQTEVVDLIGTTELE